MTIQKLTTFDPIMDDSLNSYEHSGNRLIVIVYHS